MARNNNFKSSRRRLKKCLFFFLTEIRFLKAEEDNSTLHRLSSSFREEEKIDFFPK
jgi:hypothetical protein